MNESSAQSEMSHGVASIPFSTIPGQSKLFVDYQTDPIALPEFYPNAVASHHDLIGRVPEMLRAYQTSRGRLAEILHDQQSTFGGGSKALESLHLLSDSECVAIVTGQQAGLFSGPIYTIYKALSAVKLAECLRGRGVKAVPVFWAATEDHDFDEVASVSALRGDGARFEMSNRPASYHAGIPVAKVELDDSIAGTLELFAEGIGKTGFSKNAISMLREAYKPGETFGTAFCRLMARLFESFGLIVVDPFDPRLKELASPILEAAVAKVDEIVRCLLERDKRLNAAGYHSQVMIKPDHVPFFWHDDEGIRRSLKRDKEDAFRVADTQRVLTQRELAEIARKNPERLSPGVMLRPVVQDYLFPTLCYFGGGGEIAYFAQNSEVYRVLGRPATTILHRQSFTVIEAKHRRTLDKFGLDLLDLFEGADVLVPRIVDNYLDPKSASTFADAEENVNAQLNRLDQLVSRLDTTLAQNLAKRRRKINYHLAALRTKFERARLRRDAETDRRLIAAMNALIPAMQLQERSTNVFYFLNKFGPEFIDRIYAAIDLEDKGHRVVDI